MMHSMVLTTKAVHTPLLGSCLKMSPQEEGKFPKCLSGCIGSFSLILNLHPLLISWEQS